MSYSIDNATSFDGYSPIMKRNKLPEDLNSLKRHLIIDEDSVDNERTSTPAKKVTLVREVVQDTKVTISDNLFLQSKKKELSNGKEFSTMVVHNHFIDKKSQDRDFTIEIPYSKMAAFIVGAYLLWKVEATSDAILQLQRDIVLGNN